MSQIKCLPFEVGILAKEYLRSLLQRTEEGDKSQEPIITKENNV
jgi:hypothetical protein